MRHFYIYTPLRYIPHYDYLVYMPHNDDSVIYMAHKYMYICPIIFYSYINYNKTDIYEPRSEKTGLRGFRPGPTQTGLYSHRR